MLLLAHVGNQLDSTSSRIPFNNSTTPNVVASYDYKITQDYIIFQIVENSL
jgi:hypothetical protein